MLVAVGATIARPAGAQRQPASTSSRPTAPAAPAAVPVGALAPDFALSGATRYGLLRSPVRLSDYRGQTVVLAFFYQARTKG